MGWYASKSRYFVLMLGRKEHKSRSSFSRIFLACKQCHKLTLQDGSNITHHAWKSYEIKMQDDWSSTLTRLMRLIRSWMSPSRSIKCAEILDPWSGFFPLLGFKGQNKRKHYKRRQLSSLLQDWTSFAPRTPWIQTAPRDSCSTMEELCGDVFTSREDSFLCTWQTFWEAAILGVAKRSIVSGFKNMSHRFISGADLISRHVRCPAARFFGIDNRATDACKIGKWRSRVKNPPHIW